MTDLNQVVNNDSNVNKYNNEDLENKKKFIIDKVRKFNNFEHIEILKIIKKNNIKYSENNNGIFINLNLMNEQVINKIEEFVKYCIVKKKNLINENSKIENYKNILLKNNSNVKSKPVQNEKINKDLTFIFNEELDIDQNDMYYKDSTFKLPEIK